MASITKRGNKWRARASYVDAKGQRQQPSKTFDTKKAATEWAAKIESKIFDGTDFANAKKTFPEYYREWVRTYKEPVVRKSTLTKYQTYANEIEKLFGNVAMERLTTLYLQNKINEYGETHTKAYVKNVLATIKASLKDALIDGTIKKDIFSRLLPVGDKSKDDDNFLSASDFEKLQDWLYANVELMKQDRFYLAVLIALETGARAGEVLALNVSDFDFRNGTMTINKSYSRGEITEPKTASSIRIIDVTPNLLNVIKIVVGEGRLFHKTWFQDNLSNRMKNLADEIRIEPVRFHGLRHSHVSYLLHNGVDIAYVSKRVGHSNINITLNTYAHMLKEKETEQATTTLNLLQKYQFTDSSDQK
ncbi:site-specific integrase [Weissella confusa]|uniref:site-specific integrase n=1 Tax=Weissella confusa TaxID=1583 RepID=UPI001C6F637B|nr:site-specific integrase [Weissella confusa]QYU58161.1 site-specific integrase [Weissella confusa]